jgi:hypothetical protein
MRRTIMYPLPLVLVIACTPAAQSVSAANPALPLSASSRLPPDFAFRFQISSCIPRSIDTFAGTLTRFEPRRPPVHVPFRLSDAEAERFYDELLRAGFFSLPEEVQTNPDTLKDRLTRVPYSGYRLEVRAGGRIHTVHWADEYLRAPAVERLHPLVRQFWEMYRRGESEQQIAPPNVGCL